MKTMKLNFKQLLCDSWLKPAWLVGGSQRHVNNEVLNHSSVEPRPATVYANVQPHSSSLTVYISSTVLWP